MAVIGLQPIMLKDATFTVAADNYTASITEVIFVPQVIWSWHEALCSITSTPLFERVRWVCQVGFVQDLITTGALTSYLIANAAQTKTVIFAPKAGGLAVQADVMIIPASIGGVPGQQMTASVGLPLYGQPTLGAVV